MRRFSYLATAALFAGLLLAPSTARAQGMPAELPAKINKAIDDGVVWLKARQKQDGAEKDSWGTGNNPLYPGFAGAGHPIYIGTTAFALYTLLECDVDPEDPVIVRGLDYITKNLDKSFSVAGAKVGGAGNMQVTCYECGVLLMMIESYYDAKWEKSIRAQKKDPKKEKKPAVKLDAEHETWAKGAVSFLAGTQSRPGGWRYGPPAFPSPHGVDQDTSSTQIALLGLVSAVRMGLQVDSKVFHTAVITTLENQAKDGPPAKAKPAGVGGTMVMDTDKCRGWSYTPNSGDPKDQICSGGMTASGVCSLIIIKSQMKGNALFNKELAARVEKGIFDGLAWIDANWTVSSNPGGHRSHYYYLYGLERVGILGGIETIGGNAWYVQGAQYLVDHQNKDGHWDSGTELEPRDVFDSCFALLFLKKATMPVGVTLTR
ncbi:MAG: hypothetical protein FD180_3712 [Planctomycetota bacterium]|nr:MAG: hypothetical protein FD180_3712 [Planctomycetota bacterium]